MSAIPRKTVCPRTERGRFGYFFFLLGGGEGGSRRQKGGGRGRFFIEIPGGGAGLPERRRGGPKGREGVCGALGGGGRAKYFFRGRNAHQDKLHHCGLAGDGDVSDRKSL